MWACYSACGILILQPGIESRHLAVEVQGPRMATFAPLEKLKLCLVELCKGTSIEDQAFCPIGFFPILKV